MKRICTCLYTSAILFLAYFQAHAQLTGIKTIGGATPNYPSLSLAIDALNTQGAGAGGVTFAIAAGYTETLANKVISTTTGSAANPILFTRTGTGPNPLITASAGTSTTVDGIIKIAGADYVTIDGIDLLDPTSNTSTTTRMEWGYAIVKGSATNGSQHITIRNCTVTLQKAYTTSKAIYSGNHISTSTSSLTVTNFTGTNSYIDIYSNTLTNCYAGVYMAGYNNANYYDDSVRVGTYGQNVITNFGGTSTVAYAVYLQYIRYAEVANDSINGGTGSSMTLYGVYLPATAGVNALVQNNYIQLAGTADSYGINTATGSAGNNVTVTGNRVMNCSFSGSIKDFFFIYSSTLADTYISNNTVSTNTTTSTIGTVNGICVTSKPLVLNIYSNQILNNNLTPGSGDESYGIIVAGTANVYNNLIAGNTNNGTNGEYYAISASGGGNIYGNNIYSNTSGTSNTAHYGIYTTGGSANVYQNNIYNLSGAGTGVTQGIALAGAGGVTYQVYQNKVFGLGSTGTSTVVSGIVQSGLSTATISNNLVGLLTSGTSTTTTNGINGINVTSSTDGTVTNLYHNTIYLNATSTGGTNGILLNVASLATVANNIVVNTSANSTNANRAACALKRTGTTYTTYLTASGNNVFYVGSVSIAFRYVYYDGSNSFQTMPLYQAYASSRDQASLSASISFLSTTGTSPDFLKINSATPSQLESAGKIIAAITGDFLSATSRASYPLAGQVNGGGTAPDMGAYELDLVPADSSGPLISFTSITKGMVGSFKAVDNVSITDPSGVNINSGNSPRIYYKKSTQANVLAAANNNSVDGWKYVETTSSASPFSFTIDYSLLYPSGSVSDGDVIQYFMVAQDNSTLQNTRIKGATLATAATSVALVSGNFPATSPSSFQVVAAGLQPFITVGASGNYTSFTQAGGLFDAINNGVVTNNVDVYVSSDITTETGAIALNKFAEEGPGAGTFTITIRPFSNYTVSGTNTSSGLIRMIDVERVTFDGTSSGITRDLTFENKARSGNNAVFHLVSSGFGGGCKHITIKNCNIFTDSGTTAGNNGIFVGGASIGTGNLSSGNQGIDHSYININHNAISSAYNGILVNGSLQNPVDSLNIINNEIGSDLPAMYIGSAGISLINAGRVTVSANKIYNIMNGFSFNLYGMNLGQNVLNANISSNSISNIFNTAQASVPVYGMYLAGSSNGNVSITNNAITKILGQGAAATIATGPVGIYLNTGSNYKVINNSITLSGNRLDNTVGNAYTACLFVGSTATNINVSNNVLKNIMTSSNLISGGNNFAFFSSAPKTAYTLMNNNLYYAASTTGGMVNALGYMGSVLSDLAAWRGFTGMDKQSLWGDPGYVSDSVVQADPNNPGSWNINGHGNPTTEVTADYAGNNRSTAVATGASDIGAVEVTPQVVPGDAVLSATPLAGTTTYFMVAKDTIAAITWAPGSVVPSSIAVKYYSGTNIPVSNSYKFMNSYWDIQSSPNVGLNYNIKLYYKPEALGTIVSESSLVMAKRDVGSPWVSYLGGTTVVDQVAKTMAVSGMSSFSSFTGTDASAPLPVKLASLFVQRIHTDVLLSWTTASEVNTASFEVQRSYDGKNYTAIGTVKAAGNAARAREYSFTDQQACKGRKAIYYRLNMKDLDGKAQYSNVVMLKVDAETQTGTITAYPNPLPAGEGLSIRANLEAGDQLAIELTDLTGQVVMSSKQTINTDLTAITIAGTDHLQAGMYLLKVTVNNIAQVQKLVMQ